jgi:hypothetical protein
MEQAWKSRSRAGQKSTLGWWLWVVELRLASTPSSFSSTLLMLSTAGPPQFVGAVGTFAAVLPFRYFACWS